MSQRSTSVSIITINYNQLEVTCEMLDSIRRLELQPQEIIVIDNASSKSPKQYLEANYPEVTFIQSDTNLGFSGGNNLGIAKAKGEYLYLVNNDTELLEESITPLLQLFEENAKLGIVSPLICYHPDQHDNKSDLIQYAGTTEVNPYTARNSTIGSQLLDEGQFTKAVPTAYAHGAAMMIPRKVVDEVGNMPEQFFLYYEELDWCEQIRRAGYEIFVEPRARIYHKESVSVGQMSTLKTFYLNRNRIFFMRRNKNGIKFIFFSLFLIFFTIPKNAAFYLVKGQFDHLQAFLSAIWWNILQKKV
ncbi:MAG: GT2 family glycosyltransferase [Polaribacter sp.]|jgi:GT2 family glycosyltransferase